MSTFPYAEISNIFNPNDFGSIGETLSLTEADLRYIRQGGPANVSSLMINSQPVDFSAISGVVAGVAQGGKALILNSTGNITGINDLSSSFLKVSNTSSTTISNFAIGSTYGLHLHGVNSAMGKLAGAAISFNIDSTDGIPLASITLDKISSGVGALCIATRNGSLLDERVRFQPSGNVSIGSNTDTHKLFVNGTLSATNITGILATAAQPNITLIGTHSASLDTSFANDTSTPVKYSEWTNSVTAPVSCRLAMSKFGGTLCTSSNHPLRLGTNLQNVIYLQTSGNVSISSTSYDSHKLYVDGTLRATDITGTLLTAAQPNITSLGTLSSLTATSIIGTLQTAAQPNITSIGNQNSKIHTEFANNTASLIQYASWTNSGSTTIGAYLTISNVGVSLTTSTNHPLRLGVNGNHQLYLLTSGNVCVGALAVDTHKLYIDGSLRATDITGTLQTAAQSNITSLGTLTSLSIDGNLTFTGASRSITGLTTLSATTLTGTLSTAAQASITSLGTLTGLTIGGNLTFTGASRSITGLATLSATTLTGTLATAAQTNITSIGTLSNLTLSTGGTGAFLPNIKFWNSTTSLYDNFNHSQYLNTVAGGAVASKALIVDVNKDIGSIRNLNAVSINGSTSVSGTLGDFGGLNIDGTLVLTSSRNIVNIGTVATSGAIDSAYGLTIGGVDAITSSGIYGTLQTAAQPYISSLGTLSGLEISNTGTTLGTSSAASAYDLQFQDPSNVSGSTLGISFTIHSSAANSTITPSASIIATSTSTGSSTNYPAANIGFYTRNSMGSITGSQRERMRIHSDGKISMGRIIGDGDWNMLNDLASSTLRFGAELSIKSCYSLTWNYTAPGSDSNYLSFNCYGTSNTLVLTATDRVGVGTSTPAAGLDVSAYASVSMTGPLATGTSSAYTVNRSGTFTDSVSIYCRQAFMCGTRGMYVGSDRRVKEDISTIPPEDGVKFVREINPKVYTLKSLDKRQIGYISQELITNYSALISLLPDPNMTIEQEGDVDGAFLSLSYERIPAFLHAALKSVLDRLDAQDVIIEEMKATIATLT